MQHQKISIPTPCKVIGNSEGIGDLKIKRIKSHLGQGGPILGEPGAACRDDGIFMGESLQQEQESSWALTLTERVPEAFEIPPSDWPEKYFSGQSAKRNSRATLMSSYTRLFSSSNAVVAWPVQREHF